MRKEFVTQDAKFVYSKDDLGYQEVLDDFKTTSTITIVTYNLSNDNDDLLISAVRAASEHCSINIITNIPSRWETYYTANARNRAKKQIGLYLSKLSSETFRKDSSIFFDFSNHGKIIMTDSVVYIGSANYSSGSASHTEFGFISRDPKFIQYITSEVIPSMKNSALPYYEYDYTALLIEANVALASIYNIENELHDTVYSWYSNTNGEGFYYNDSEASLTEEILDKVLRVIRNSCEVSRELYDALVVINRDDKYETETDWANDIYDELRSIYSKIEQLSCSDELYNLSKFKIAEYVNQKLQTEYEMIAYEENLDSCIESASGDAMNVVYNLTQAAKPNIDELLKKIERFRNEFSSFLKIFQMKETRKVNRRIDNTCILDCYSDCNLQKP